MKKIILLVAIVLGAIITQAQAIDTIRNMVIFDTANQVAVFTYKGRIDLEKTQLQPELDNYINLIKSEYCKDEIFICVQYQNVSESGTGKERFGIVKKDNPTTYVNLDELSPALQESIYLFSLKLKAIIKDEN